ncbi:N-acetyltransferase [Actinotalea sp. BY-33]|uniref:N-acetyltransferase n=1 Tax=Actinotalea soli TaxID=2819234 RepID=A0A939LSD9_9CELL|nr:GNAT family N-acetyltransferase [Actinotalea soli]MBO1751815.1 N-acetyltransferase [Actinotalea soli]
MPGDASASWSVRDASPADGEACARIYAPYVTGTTVTFETEAPTVEQMTARIAAAQAEHAWLVLEAEGAVQGYAYGTAFRGRPAYRLSCEVSVYLDRDLRGVGRGRALYGALLERLTASGFHLAVAGATQPNAASVALHRALGFRQVGTFHEVGWKHGGWRDVAWFERVLSTVAPEDGPA